MTVFYRVDSGRRASSVSEGVAYQLKEIDEETIHLVPSQPVPVQPVPVQPLSRQPRSRGIGDGLRWLRDAIESNPIRQIEQQLQQRSKRDISSPQRVVETRPQAMPSVAGDQTTLVIVFHDISISDLLRSFVREGE